MPRGPRAGWPWTIYLVLTHIPSSNIPTYEAANIQWVPHYNRSQWVICLTPHIYRRTHVIKITAVRTIPGPLKFAGTIVKVTLRAESWS